ncbi:bacteriocin immunity protein [Pediococcus claussenii]|uniref:Enterocin A Immunity family protein n=1 Tax=Pediococcus claussenii (strain ATCC BAA-344 / DSM 14800 / JCM 18046 / KCTC 3811 / LMG 21948 / P06) TaxID=701521 RepID=G8PB31_PEDCP|nr:bacteriocin immunity protein [Pediococcus claussenii]AEV94660.1 enterocin A Immunity family protein [Pediococcus claussenii ATCC BAA-344]ANZ69861.1 hypothetical protein AYR57_05860 [Pediococcus claussenii]ANZ71678.1 hypothetical protein AYR58_05865 [Pediococcus claussenii]
MDEKYDQLFDLIDKAFKNEKIIEDEKMKAVLFNVAKLVQDHEDYERIAADLTRIISKSYIKNHEIEPELVNIFNFVKDDVDETKIDSKKYRDRALAVGLIMTGITFH